MKLLRNATSYVSAIVVSAALWMATAAQAADSKSDKPAKEEEAGTYPGQPNINSAIKQLTKAQEQMTSEPDKAIESLQRAKLALDAASSGKGTYRQSAIRLTKQALEHLEKKDVEKAAHEIKEALEATNKAGEVGARK